MLHLQPRGGVLSHSFSSCSCKLNHLLMIMAVSKHLVHTPLSTPFTVAPKPVLNSITPSAPSRMLHTHSRRLIFTTFASKPISPIRQASRLSSLAHPDPLPPPPVSLEDGPELSLLNRKLKEIGIDGSSCVPGQYHRLLCPTCNGGNTMEKSLSLYIDPHGDAALFTCFRAKCGWRGTQVVKQNKKYRQLDEQSLKLEPLSSELLAYFSKRMISGETLWRNGVMQHKARDQIAIAFPYWRNGELVSCKYRDIKKRFWQESDTEKILYGLDDIVGASDIIIVEGEIDKLAMEEAGFRNCVSVPDGAPSSVSAKELPPVDEDTRFQYLWSCKEYFEKASRIILATDGDSPGLALAEELARRLGRERCWRVKWPKKIDGHCKDANEVLIYLGPHALRETIDNAEPYLIANQILKN